MDDKQKPLSDLYVAWTTLQEAERQLNEHWQNEPMMPVMVEDYAAIERFHALKKEHEKTKTVLWQKRNNVFAQFKNAYTDAIQSWPDGVWLRVNRVGIKLCGYDANGAPIVRVELWSMLKLLCEDEPPVELTKPGYRSVWKNADFDKRIRFLKEIDLYEGYEQ